MSNWNKIFKPIVVLVIICIVVTGALAATNGVTAPIIEEAKVAAENAARTELPAEARCLYPRGKRGGGECLRCLCGR